jgi:hypothetical protein
MKTVLLAGLITALGVSWADVQPATVADVPLGREGGCRSNNAWYPPRFSIFILRAS